MSRPVLLSASHVSKAMTDPEFFRRMPEFLPMKARMETAANAGKPGCTPCRMKRAASGLYSDFVRMVGSMSPDAASRFKQYFGVDRMVMNKPSANGSRMTVSEI